MATDTSAAVETEQPALKRHVGIIGLLFASIGSIIGSGWLFGALNASKEAGPAAIISWALGGVMVLAIALVYAELGVMFPLSGGVIRFPHLAFGSFASYTTGWITWVGASTTAPIEVLAALQYGTKYAPFTQEAQAGGQTVHTLTGLGYAVAVVLMAIFVVINYFGIRWFARINNALVWWKLGIIVLVVVAFLVSAFHGENFSSHGFKPAGWHGVFSAIATSGIVFSYLGFRQGVELAGETDNPRKNVPIAVIGSVLITAVIYIALQVAFIGALDPSLLSGPQAWSNLSFENDFGPLAALATALGLGWLAVLLYIDAIISPGDTGLIYTTLTSRLSYAMARNGNAPQRLAKTTDRGVPLFSLIVTFVVGLIVFLPFPSWQQLVGFITSATVLSFASGPLVLTALRKRVPDQPRPFRLPGGHALPLFAFWASNLIVYWSGWLTGWKLYLSVLVGFVLLGLFKVFGGVRQAPLHFWNGVSWLFPWLGGLALISYLGNFPEKSAGAGNLGVLNFEWSAVLLAALSVLVYVIATRVALPADAVVEHIEQSKEEAAVEDAELGATS
ncbi:APC family permease [Nostocoides sp. Soil756]|uniref:APC family permease n=1 Tax=Nostocoides sp. Soil756 TaxID=1736399 RepID=UPI0006F841C9|nr:APC family permease [Tetrasphaera sp. Soil756]KRE61504.1 amino acid permease [Tetrasphaera sp. Soil756]